MKIEDRIDAAVTMGAAHRSTTPPIPDSAKVELTARCNLRCKYCNVWKTDRCVGKMDITTFEMIARKLYRAGVRQIGLFLLGESTIISNLDNYVDVCSTIGFTNVFLTTNGILVTESKCRKMVDAGLTSLKFSINGFDPDHYTEVTGVDAYDNVLDNLKAAYEVTRGTPCRLSVSSIHDPSRDHLSVIFETVIRQWCDDFYWLPPYNQAGHNDYFDPIVGNVGRYDNMVDPVPCWTLFKSIKVTWDGRMTGCCFDHNNDFVCGSLIESSVEECWNSDFLQEIRRQHLTNQIQHPICKSCLKM